GWLWYVASRERAAGAFALLIAVGMTFGLVGDLSMAGLLRLGNRVIGGILAFGLGHIAYIIAILGLGDRVGLNAADTRLGAWLVWLLIGVIAWYAVVWRPAKQRNALHFAALAYALLLSSTAGFATGLALQNGLFWGLALGAALFLLSDLILAGELFSGLRFPLIGDVVWLTYGPGQMLIVYSVDAALRILP
ncbi:MAG: lysoplasmalogenase, partial [Anaerolineae bacterium]|nr:lysoplasmalogenase [Anaerolineae bacterium]